MDTTALTKDTRLCMSLSARPSNLGTRFHNYLYSQLGLDYVYKGFAISDIRGAMAGVRALGVRGCAISMPFKETVMAELDGLEASAQGIGAVNTVVNDDGVLRGYNTDYLAVRELVTRQGLPTSASVAVIGSGGMAMAVAAALRDAGFSSGTVVARNGVTGPGLAQRYGFQWRQDADSLHADLLVNASPVGMAGGPDAHALPVPSASVAAASCVFDAVAVPEETPLVALARSQGIPVVLGTEVWALQAGEQFALYTGTRPTAEQVSQAAAFARSSQ